MDLAKFYEYVDHDMLLNEAQALSFPRRLAVAPVNRIVPRPRGSIALADPRCARSARSGMTVC